LKISIDPSFGEVKKGVFTSDFLRPWRTVLKGFPSVPSPVSSLPDFSETYNFMAADKGNRRGGERETVSESVAEKEGKGRERETIATCS